jgi:hypothetical protein
MTVIIMVYVMMVYANVMMLLQDMIVQLVKIKLNNYFIIELPDCGSHSSLNHISYTCLCDEGYYRANCENKKCPKDCNNNGKCSNDGTCICNDNFKGIDCSISKIINFNHNLRKVS